MTERGRVRTRGAHVKELAALGGRWVESWRNRGLAVAYHARDKEVARDDAVRDDDKRRAPPVWDLRWATDVPKERF